MLGPAGCFSEVSGRERHDEDAWTVFAHLEAVSEMSGQRSSIMCDENAVLVGSYFQDLGIAQS